MAAEAWGGLSSWSPSGEQDAWTWPLGRAGTLRPQAHGFPILRPLLIQKTGAHSPGEGSPGSRLATRPPTYQEEHPLLQALLGERVQAALTDELLQDSDAVPRGGPRPRSTWQLAGGLASPSPLTLLQAPLQEPLAGPAQRPTRPLCLVPSSLLPAPSGRPGPGWVPVNSVPRVSAERLLPASSRHGPAEPRAVA